MNNQSSLPAGGRLPSLDGWRAFAISIVLLSHCQYLDRLPPQWLPFVRLCDGRLGVSFFFAISGFLITWLLEKERLQTGHINLSAFYIRRSFRILPVYFTYLAVIALLQLFTSFHQNLIGWIANLTFTTSYFPPDTDVARPAMHLWSLSVEEQFYLLWPLCLLLLTRLFASPYRVFALALPIILAPVARIIEHLHLPVSSYVSIFSIFCNMDALAIGCLAALVLQAAPQLFDRLLTTRPHLVLGIGVALIAVPYTLFQLRVFGAFTVPFASTSEVLGFSILMLQSLFLPSFSLYRILNLRPVQFIGVLSYSLYIWQQLFLYHPSPFGFSSHWWNTFPGWLPASFLLAVLSYFLIEKPLIGFRKKFLPS